MTFRSAYTTAASVQDAADDLITQLGVDGAPAAVLLFVAHGYDGAKLSDVLHRHWPGTPVVGCTTAGEFTQQRTGVDGISALALPSGSVVSAHAELAGFRQGVESGITAGTGRLEASLGRALRGLDRSRWVGFVLIDGLNGDEEAANVALGRVNPMLSFVGGSAGDGLEFEQTRVFCNGRETDHGAALLLLELSQPFTVLKTCSFRPRTEGMTITKANPATRTVYEIDGRPVLQAYAEAVGVKPDELGPAVFMRHPLGLVIDGEPWIRSPREAGWDGGLKFYCQIQEGMVVHVMDSADLIADTRAALAEADVTVGGARGAVLFNCILRRLQMDAEDLHPQWLDLLGDLPTAGFHTYGESWLGHINQTCTGVVFG